MNYDSVFNYLDVERVNGSHHHSIEVVASVVKASSVAVVEALSWGVEAIVGQIHQGASSGVVILVLVAVDGSIPEDSPVKGVWINS